VKRLSKVQQQEKQRLCDQTEATTAALEEQVRQYNEVLAQEWAKIEARLAEVNETIGSLNGFLDDVTDEMDGYFSERSEKWQEGEGGTSYASWKDQWQTARLDEIEIDEPAEVEAPEVPVEQVLELPDAPDEED